MNGTSGAMVRMTLRCSLFSPMSPSTHFRLGKNGTEASGCSASRASRRRSSLIASIRATTGCLAAISAFVSPADRIRLTVLGVSGSVWSDGSVLA